MNIYTEGHTAVNALAEIIRAMTGERAVPTDNESTACVISRCVRENGRIVISTTIKNENGAFTQSEAFEPKPYRDEKQNITDCVKKGYYNLAARVYAKTLPWGCSTSIRPVKTAASCKNIRKMYEDFRISEKKAKLALDIVKVQQNIKFNENNVSVYIGIPFCPTRCLYCSFVSMPMNKQQKLVSPYIELLCREIETAGEIIRSCGRKINTVYIGGGTPTSVDEKLLNMLLNCVSRTFLSSETEEFTVEAGRPDTVTEEKLKIMKNCGVNRISINPQTLNDEILMNIGRRHTAAQFTEAFELARRCGFDNINTDVIAGLVGETEEMFKNSLGRLLELSPEGVTVHTMCVKRAADLKKLTGGFKSEPPENMVDYANISLRENGYIPYYLYRQKDTLGNLENTGFSKPGHECLYNIFMMEDIGSVIGIGAGAVSKIKNNVTNNIQRVFNLKNAHEYIRDFDEIIKRKYTVGKYLADVMPKFSKSGFKER